METLESVSWQKGRGENMAQAFIVVFARMAGQGKANSLGLATLNNFSGLSATGVV